MHRPCGNKRSFPNIPEAPASPCNIIHCEPINCKSKLHLVSPIAECDVNYLLKNQTARVHWMLFPGQKGNWPSASPVTASPSPEQRESRLFSTSRQRSSRKPKFSDSIGTGRMWREVVKTTWQASQRVWLPPVAGPWCYVIAGPGYQTAHYIARAR